MEVPKGEGVNIFHSFPDLFSIKTSDVDLPAMWVYNLVTYR